MPERILLIRLSAVGDVINTLPALSLLRRARPDAHLGYLVEDRARDLIAGHPFLDAVYVFPRRRWRQLARSGDPRSWRRLRREAAEYRGMLRAASFDVALDFQGNLKGALHARLCGAPRRIGFARGYDRELSHCFATEHVVPPADRPHRVDKFASLLGPLGVTGAAREYVLPPAPEARARVAALLRASGLGGRRLVLVHPGTSERGAAKRWPPERFASLAAGLVHRAAVDVLVTWGPGERPLAEEVATRARRSGSGPATSDGEVRLGPETTSLLELAELIRRAALFISADTGPMHLSAACGIPCVALFGPKDPAIYRPYGEGHTVLRRAAAEGRPSMLAITPDEVIEAAVAALGGAAAAGDRTA